MSLNQLSLDRLHLKKCIWASNQLSIDQQSLDQMLCCSTDWQSTKCQAPTFSGGHISSETLRDENWKEMFPFFSAPDQFPDYRSGGQWVALFFFSYICKCPVSASQHPTTCCDSWAFRKCPSVRTSLSTSSLSSSLLSSPPSSSFRTYNFSRFQCYCPPGNPSLWQLHL